MAEINEEDALKIIEEYYTLPEGRIWRKAGQRFIDYLKKCGVIGLVIFAYKQGVSDERGENSG